MSGTSTIVTVAAATPPDGLVHHVDVVLPAAAATTTLLDPPTVIAVATLSGLPGPAGPAAPGTVRVIQPVTDASSVEVDHGFSYRPIVAVTDSAGVVCDADIEHGPGAVFVHFAAPFTGAVTLL